MLKFWHFRLFIISFYAQNSNKGMSFLQPTNSKDLVYWLCVEKNLLNMFFGSFLSPFWGLSLNSKFLLVGSLLSPSGATLLNICTWILLLNTPGMSYLHHLKWTIKTVILVEFMVSMLIGTKYWAWNSLGYFHIWPY